MTIIKRMGGVPKEKQAEEGINLAIEQIEELKSVPGIRGFHIMAIEWEEKVPEIVERAGLYPRPQVEAVDWSSTGHFFRVKFTRPEVPCNLPA